MNIPLTLALLAASTPSVGSLNVETLQDHANVGSEVCAGAARPELCQNSYVIARLSERQVRACRMSTDSEFRLSYAGNPRFEEDFRRECGEAINLCRLNTYQFFKLNRRTNVPPRFDEIVAENVRGRCGEEVVAKVSEGSAK